jgi:DNA polymerase
MNQQLLNEIIDETAELLRRAAHPTRGTVPLAPETAALLEQFASRQAEVTGERDCFVTDPAPRNDESETSQPDTSHHFRPSCHSREGGNLPSTRTQPIAGVQESASSDPMAALREEVRTCVKCALCQTRTQTVFADGNPNADLVFVGEAPGFYEDQQGVPFVGKAGQLLTDIIVKGMKMRREDVYICNVIKCRPPDNRDPTPEEKRQCERYLVRQLQLVQPKVIVALGGHAAKTLLKTDAPTGKLRGRWHFYEGIPLRVTFHPAYLLRNPSDKRLTWDDVQEVMKVLSGEADPRPAPETGTLFG